VKTTQLFAKLEECTKPIIVLQGGGDAAKTVTALQWLAIDSIRNKNTLTTVTDQTVPAIKAGALNSFQQYVLPDISKYIIDYNETERRFRFWNKSRLEFKSFQDESLARGSERQNLFMNECNAQTYKAFWQLQRKTRKRIILDYNPTSPFWVHDKLIGFPVPELQFKGKVQLYIVDHRSNPYLTQEEHDRYEMISDPELFRVYARGLTGRIQGLIFGHFRKWGSNELPTDAVRNIWGIDYGYTNDPTALVKIAVGQKVVRDGMVLDLNPRRRVAKELCYEPGLSAESLRNIFMLHGLQPNDVIYSEADPNMINQLRLLGLPVYPAIKGAGSVAAGIGKVREHECYYTPDSVNFNKEIMTYSWMKAQDITTGKEVMTNVPVDAWNHCCDAFRMADYTDSFRNR
jgi:phage terminase large subunit